MSKNVILRRGKEESLKRFHPWIFSGAVMNLEGNPEEGDVVTVLDSQHNFLCQGHWQGGSLAVRVLTFEQEPIDDAFWQKRLGEALGVRQAIGLADSEAGDTYRLVHGEGDLLPGLVIDVYGKTAVMQAHSVGMHVSREQIAAALKQVPSCEFFPMEAVRTNVIGTDNVLTAAIEAGAEIGEKIPSAGSLRRWGSSSCSRRSCRRGSGGFCSARV